MKQLWDRLADDLLHLDFVRQREAWNPEGLLDGLERTLKFSKRSPWQVSTWLRRVAPSTGESLAKHAMAERDFRNRGARHIVYGHTHHAETVPLDSTCAGGGVLNQLYFNSGAWRRVYRQTQCADGQCEFIPADEMTYLAFFQGDERKGRPFETWTGALGVELPGNPIYRVDAGGPTHAGHKPISTSNLHEHRPHFNVRSPDAGYVPERRV